MSIESRFQQAIVLINKRNCDFQANKRQSNKLTVNIVCSKLLFVLRACSSMVEQWPFKPLVEGSSPSTLTKM